MKGISPLYMLRVNFLVRAQVTVRLYSIYRIRNYYLLYVRITNVVFICGVPHVNVQYRGAPYGNPPTC